jgi:hypothetical protein
MRAEKQPVQSRVTSFEQNGSDFFNGVQSHSGAGAGGEDAIDQFLEQSFVIAFAPDRLEFGQAGANRRTFFPIAFLQFVNQQIHPSLHLRAVKPSGLIFGNAKAGYYQKMRQRGQVAGLTGKWQAKWAHFCPLTS